MERSTLSSLAEGEGEGGGGSTATLFATDDDVAFVAGERTETEKNDADKDEAETDAAENKRREAASAEDREMVAALEHALEGDEGGEGAAPGLDSGSPLPPYARQRGTVRENTVVAVDLAKKVKLKEPPTPANTYAAKKTVAQGMMDIALITSNANQLRYLFEFASGHTFFQLNVSLIIISLFLQIAVGVTLIFKGRADLSGQHKMAHANRLNNYVVGGVFLVTIINVFLAAFSVSNTDVNNTVVNNGAQPPVTTPSVP